MQNIKPTICYMFTTMGAKIGKQGKELYYHSYHYVQKKVMQGEIFIYVIISVCD